MPLTIVKNGEASYIKRITGKDEVRHRLAEMGFVTGECVTVVSKIGGNMILTIKGTRVALDKNMAGRIMV